MADRPRFDAEYVPRLRTLAAVESTDGSWEPPPMSRPTLVLHAAARGDYVLDLVWGWAYRVGDAELRSPLPAGVEGHRDRDAERPVLEAVSTAVEKAGLEPAAVIGRGTRLGGLETLRFVTEVLPQLEDSDDVRVELDGEHVAYGTRATRCVWASPPTRPPTRPPTGGRTGSTWMST